MYKRASETSFEISNIWQRIQWHGNKETVTLIWLHPYNSSELNMRYNFTCINIEIPHRVILYLVVSPT